MHKISGMRKDKKNIKLNDELIELGIFGRASGIRGEIRLNIYSESSENITEGQKILAENEVNGVDEGTWLTVNSIRMHDRFYVVKFKEIRDRTEASLLTGRKFYISRSDMRPLSEDEVYVRDLIGMTVYDRASETEIGTVKDVMTNTAQPLYVIKKTGGGEILIPGVKEFIKRIDIDAKKVEVELIPGFIEDEI